MLLCLNMFQIYKQTRIIVHSKVFYTSPSSRFNTQSLQVTSAVFFKLPAGLVKRFREKYVMSFLTIVYYIVLSLVVVDV